MPESNTSTNASSDLPVDRESPPPPAPPTTPQSALSGSNSSDRSLLFQLLRGRDVPCPLCRYNLRDLQQDRCPECGRVIELWVRTPEKFYAAWITSVIASSLSTPAGVIFIFAILTGGNMWFFTWQEWVFGLVGLYMLVATIMLILLRKSFIQAEPRTKKLIAISCIACSISAWVIALLSIFR